jgi:hypothetical protein
MRRFSQVMLDALQKRVIVPNECIIGDANGKFSNFVQI